MKAAIKFYDIDVIDTKWRYKRLRVEQLDLFYNESFIQPDFNVSLRWIVIVTYMEQVESRDMLRDCQERSSL